MHKMSYLLLLGGQNHGSMLGELVEMGLILNNYHLSLLQPCELILESVPDAFGDVPSQEGL